jgi:tetratricopeptide (TPR) repeat protein
MRSLGRYHFFQQDYKKAIECYERALSINRLYADSWFTLGCSYMRSADWKNAIYSFGTSISIDDQNAEGWCNIASCYMQQDKSKEAIVCLEQALKQKRKSWQIWENYIILCLDTRQFHKSVNAARELIRLDMIERVNVNLMLKICDVFLKNYVASSQHQKKDESQE